MWLVDVFNWIIQMFVNIFLILIALPVIWIGFWTAFGLISSMVLNKKPGTKTMLPNFLWWLK